jgi:hypothetical protein
VASSAGVMLLGLFILVAALARRLYLHRRVHPLGPGPDDDDEEEAFYGAQVGQAWGEPFSTAAHERLLYRGGGGSGGGDALGASASLYEQFGRVQHYSYDPAARVEPDVGAVMQDIIKVLTILPPLPPTAARHPHAMHTPPPARRVMMLPEGPAGYRLAAPPLSPASPQLPAQAPALPSPTPDSVRLVRARTEAHRKQLEAGPLCNRSFFIPTACRRSDP